MKTHLTGSGGIKVKKRESKHGKKPEYQIKIAKERIAILINEAEKIAEQDMNLARRYFQLARKIGMRYNIRLGKTKRKFCKNCYTYLIPGKTSQHKIKNGTITITCILCRKSARYPYKKSQSKYSDL